MATKLRSGPVRPSGSRSDHRHPRRSQPGRQGVDLPKSVHGGETNKQAALRRRTCSQSIKGQPSGWPARASRTVGRGSHPKDRSAAQDPRSGLTAGTDRAWQTRSERSEGLIPSPRRPAPTHPHLFQENLNSAFRRTSILPTDSAEDPDIHVGSLPRPRPARPRRLLARIIQCAVTRRYSSAGANPARQLSLQPVAVGADDGGNDIG